MALNKNKFKSKKGVKGEKKYVSKNGKKMARDSEKTHFQSYPDLPDYSKNK